MSDLPLVDRLALTPEEIEALTGISARHVRECVKDGLVRRVPYTSRILIARAELDRWLAGNEAGAA